MQTLEHSRVHSSRAATGRAVRIAVITSCTARKAITSPDRLTLADFRKGAAHVRDREHELRSLLRPAEALYTGQQHQRLMRGVARFRTAWAASPRAQLELVILSAGYGWVPADRWIAPYEATWIGMRRAQRYAWAEQLQVHERFCAVLAAPYDLALLLLGHDYLEVCDLEHASLGGPTLMFCGERQARVPWPASELRAIALRNADARRFSCGMTALKGELAGRILAYVACDLSHVTTLLDHDPPALLNALSALAAVR